jgi:hypothetical protein
MAEWALVENNQILEFHDFLPNNWKNISGLRRSENDLNFLQSIGWYKVVKQHQSYDESQFNVVKYNYDWTGSSVIETVELAEKTTLDENEYETYLPVGDLRKKRDALLKDSDWTQLADVQSLMDNRRKLMWIEYRQKLRDLPEQCENGTSIEIDSIIWPVRPT